MSYRDRVQPITYTYDDGRTLRGETRDGVTTYTLDGERLTEGEVPELLKKLRVEVAANRQSG